MGTLYAEPGRSPTSTDMRCRYAATAASIALIQHEPVAEQVAEILAGTRAPVIGAPGDAAGADPA